MKTRFKYGLAALVLLAAAPAFGQTAVDCGKADCTAFNADRAAILGMAGTYRVKFDFRETVAFVPDYEPIEPKRSGGFEAVRVIEDTGRVIRLQHLLVVKDEEDKPFIIKHWRQDWTYEPETVLTYEGPDQWKLTPVPAADRADAWAQTVWQTDDSPRYGGVGQWKHDRGEHRWISGETARPLARRDAIRKPIYDRYVGTNRHALTHAGWVHEQDNAKVGTRGGTLATIVHEVVLNSYVPSTDFDFGAADDYMRKTAGFWAAVRRQWDDVALRDGGIHLMQEAENGSSTGKQLMELADRLAKEEVTLGDAVSRARFLIDGSTKPAAATAGASRG
ncbi:DUF6607 family protein [Niveispirillum fermenti]|uniref:DUF6607 family protein n=1 Tax=Niveispirillum fermenti TaxID=1233113 RepID=UPI003A844BB5